MTIKETRNELFANKIIKNLERRHFEAYYCPTASEAKEKALELIAKGSSVSWGGSMTIRDIGLTSALKGDEYVVYDRDDVTTAEDKRRIYLQAFDTDYYLGSVNAMTEDGILINIDGNGNRVAAMTWGPHRVLLFVSLNKVCQDVDSAIKRARSTAAPINMMRFDSLKTPCHADGACHDCLSEDSICNYISITRMSHPAKRHIVILVGEDLGY